MHVLDDAGFVTRLDPKGMLRLTVEYPAQVRRAMDVARAAALPDWKVRPDLVVLTGLGGSAAGGDFTRALFEDAGTVPFLVNRDYALPAFVGGGALVFAVSYSGNTEETIAAYVDARRRGASLIVVTSGGKLAEMAREDGYPLILIPGGQPPRTALGYLFVPVVVACERMGLLPAQPWERLLTLLEECVADWGVDKPFEQNEAKRLAQEQFFGRLAVIYGLGPWQALVANRWKGQINENGKNMTFANAFPELCHNEILGWVKADEQGVTGWSAVVLEDGTESAKMKARAAVTAELIRPVSGMVYVRSRGPSLIEKVSSLTLLGDFVSLYLAALNGVDPENIDSINTLKARLADVP